MPGVRWKKGEKERMLALHRDHNMTVAELQKVYYPERSIKSVGQVLWATKRKYSASKQCEMNPNTTTTPFSRATTTTTDSDSDSEEETSILDKHVEDNHSSSGPVLSKLLQRIKFTYSTKSCAPLAEPQEQPGLAIAERQRSEVAQTLDESMPIVSPGLGRHRVASIPDQARPSQDHPMSISKENTGSSHCTPPLPPPPPPSSLPPISPTPPPPPPLHEMAVVEQVPVSSRNSRFDAIEKEKGPSQTQTQVREHSIKQEKFSKAEVRKVFAQKTLEIWTVLEMAFSSVDASEAEKLRLEDELSALRKQNESIQADRESQVSQLQREVEYYRNEQETLSNEREEERERLKDENASLRSQVIDLKSRLHKLASEATLGL